MSKALKGAFGSFPAVSFGLWVTYSGDTSLIPQEVVSYMLRNGSSFKKEKYGIFSH